MLREASSRVSPSVTLLFCKEAPFSVNNAQLRLDGVTAPAKKNPERRWPLATLQVPD